MKKISPSRTFSILCWNVHKEMGRMAFEQTFSHLLAKCDPQLLLLQEAVLAPQALRTLSHFQLASVKNIEMTKLSYGILSASSFEMLSHTEILTHIKELYCMTKKGLLITSYRLNEKTALYVVNLHAINFVSHKHFLYELQRLLEHLREVDAPLIVAGDFNTWSKRREHHLEAFAASLGLTKAAMEDAHYIKTLWKKPLDHIFYRDLELLRAKAIDTQKVSDHNPLWAKFRYNDAS